MFQLTRVEAHFNELKNRPQSARFIPPVSSSIQAARLTLNTIKYSIVRFLQSQPELFEEEEVEAETEAAEYEQKFDQRQEGGDHSTDLTEKADEVPRKKGRGVRQQYITLAHQLQEFEAEKFKAWENDMLTSLNSRLNQSILYENPTSVPFHKVSISYVYRLTFHI